MLYRIAGTLIGEPVQQLVTTRTTSSQRASAPLHSVVLMSPIGGLAPPSLLTAPTIAVQGGGDPVVGATFVATTGTTQGVVDTTVWQWYRDGVAIAGETGTTYVSTSPGDVGGDVDITVQQTVANGAGSDSATSNALTVLTLFTMDQLTGTRASEAAYWDPRTSTFVQQVGDAWRILDPENDVASSFYNVVTATITANVDGVADEIEDTDGAALRLARSDRTIGAEQGKAYRWTLKVQQDSDTTRFPGFRITFTGTTGNCTMILNTQTGATDTHCTGAYSAFDTVSVTDDGAGYWLVVLVSTATANATGNARLDVYPSYSTTFDASASENAATGSIIVKGSTAEDNDAGWLQDDELCLLDEGLACLFQEDRENVVEESYRLNTGWATVGGATVAVSSVAAPDGGIAYDITDADGAQLGYLTDGMATAGAGDHIFSFFVQKSSGTVAAVRLASSVMTNITVEIRTSDGASSVSEGSTTVTVEDAGSDWWRVSFPYSTTGAGTVFPRPHPAYNASLGSGSDVTQTGTCAFWGFQGEESANFPTSPIRTSGAAAAVAAEQGVLASASVPLAMLSGAWSYVWQPLMSSAELIADGASLTHFAFGGSVSPNDSIQVLSSAAWRMRIGGTVEVAQAITWNRLDEIAITIDLAAGEVTIAGALTGNGTYSMSSGSGLSWGSGDVTISPLNGVRGILHTPVAA